MKVKKMEKKAKTENLCSKINQMNLKKNQDKEKFIQVHHQMKKTMALIWTHLCFKNLNLKRYCKSQVKIFNLVLTLKNR